MSKYLASFTPCNIKSSLIHVTGYEDRRISGYVENPFFTEPRYFDNLIQFFMVIDKLCDDICYPQRTNENRSLLKGEEKVFKSKAPRTRGKTLATFKLDILFRQNSSWQGSVLWMEQQVGAQFRSALELVMLIDSVLTSLPEK